MFMILIPFSFPTDVFGNMNVSTRMVLDKFWVFD